MSRSLLSRITNVVQADATKKYIKIGESTTIESLKRFCCIAPPTHYVIKGNKYNMGYYLADDVECVFGVLQSRFAIVAGPSRFWNKHVLHNIMIACIIMHNMIIEDEHDVNATINDWMQAPIPTVDMRVDENTRFQEFLARQKKKKIKDKEAHIALRNVLIDHLWDEFSNSNN
ncbi:nuclease [Citrus sinensis]|uniref:Nuclease n=1 Tax=Citrus sinensis TaxID=2711 RepID=A0ACB8M645_CITSI|nr:nuclease [Citrus sinensis]